MGNPAMADVGHLCGVVNCQLPACVFGFVEGRCKLPVCSEHLSTLYSQELPTFEIAAYEFLETEEDYSLYLQRQVQAARGLKKITALEERCSSDWRVVGRLLENSAKGMEKAIVQEIRLQSEQCYEAMKLRLSEIRLLLGQITKDKNTQLTAKYEVVSTGSLFILVQEEGHCYLEVTETGAALVPAQAELARLQAVLRVKGEGDSVRNWVAAKTIVRQFGDAATQSGAQIVVQGYVRRAMHAREEGNYVKALKKLQKGKVALQQRDLDNALLCMHMGQVKAYFGKWTEAEAELKQGLDYQMSTSPASELAAQLSISLVELYHQQEKWEETVKQAEWTLHTCAGTEQVLERLQALYYLMEIWIQISTDERRLKLFEKWLCEQVVSSVSCECVHLCIQAETMRSFEKYEVATRLFKQALALSKFPAYSYFIVTVSKSLGSCYESRSIYWPAFIQQVSTTYAKVAQTFKTHFPHSNSAFSHFDLYYNHIQNRTGTESLYKELLPFYSAQFPQSLAESRCLSEIARCLIEDARYEYDLPSNPDAQQYYNKADAIFSSNFPRSSEYARNLCLYRVVFKNEATPEEVRDKLVQAYNIAFTHLPHTSTLIESLKEMSQATDSMGEMGEIEDLYLKAYQVLLTRFPLSHDFPEFLISFGLFYQCLEEPQYEKAEEKLLQAYYTSVEHCHDPAFINNIRNDIRDLYSQWGRTEKVGECFAQGCEISAAQGAQSWFHALQLAFLAEWHTRNDAQACQDNFQKALHILAGNEKYSLHYLDVLLMSAISYEKLLSSELAEEAYVQAYRHYSQSEAYKHSERYQCVPTKVGKFYERQGNMKAAEEFYMKGTLEFYYNYDEDSSFLIRDSKLREVRKIYS